MDGPAALPAAQDHPTATTAGPEPQPAAVQSAPAYPPPAARPTQHGPRGILFDFNLGCRVILPEGKWRLCLRDLDTGNVLFETQNTGAFVNSSKRYFVRFRIEVWEQDEPVLRHDYDAKGRDVLIQFPVGTLGDTLGWFPYAVKFQQRHRCRLTCAMSGLIILLFRDAYPDITFVTHEQVRAEQFYATYSIGLFFDDADCVWQPCDFRHVGLHRTAGYILGVDAEEVPPRIAFADEGPPLAEPYVCIAVQSSSACKNWNNPNGWREVVRFLKDSGYRVVCIDQKPLHGHGLVWTHIPHGADDETGDRPLAERARWLRHAAFFVGLSSCDDSRLHPSDQRIRHPVPGDQLPRMQQLLERSAGAVRPQGFPVVPAPCRHATPVRMHEADHGGAGATGHPAHSGLWQPRNRLDAIIEFSLG